MPMSSSTAYILRPRNGTACKELRAKQAHAAAEAERALQREQAHGMLYDECVSA